MLGRCSCLKTMTMKGRKRRLLQLIRSKLRIKRKREAMRRMMPNCLTLRPLTKSLITGL